jgi:hypothetical protein
VFAETKEGTRVEKKEMEDEAAGAMKSTQRKGRLKPQPLFNNYHSWKYKVSLTTPNPQLFLHTMFCFQVCDL